MTHPLQQPPQLNQLPDFERIAPEHAAEALDRVLTENRHRLEDLLGNQASPGWQGLVEPMEQMSEALSWVWGPVSHLFMVNSTDAWRAAYNQGLPKVTEYHLELSQSEALFEAYQRLAASAEFGTLSPTRQKVVTDAIRDFKLSGVGLKAEAKQRFKEISLRLSELQTKFEEQLMDATQAWSLHITDQARLAGMSAAALEQAAAKAAAKKLDGWLLTLDYPSFDAVISHADDRTLREQLYTAFATRASDQGPHAGRFDNSALMDEILALRAEQAGLLGFGNFAELSVATKMADTPDQVEAFLLDLAQRARTAAQAELQALGDLARAMDGLEELQSWDLAYYSEKLRQQSLGLNEEALRPYFPLPAVLQGLFDLIHQLYGYRVEACEGHPVWHPDVKLYALMQDDGTVIGRFYLDPYARDQKRSGAWMDECLGRRQTEAGTQLPVAYLVCNFRPPLKSDAGEQPGLLTHDEVVTLFHEFGHGLHHLLTQVEASALAGIRGVEWDAVELPSQFMENWCYQPALLKSFARHWQSGEALPDAQIEKLRTSRVFQAGMATLRQIEFALFDLRLHRDFDAGQGARVMQTLEQVRDEVAVMRPPAFNRFPCSFSHIFAGGYSAGYYSYKWAEVLSADAFAAFDEAGLSAEAMRETGRRFLDTLLSRGGSRTAAQLFRDFRGRDPSLEPLLRQDGLISAT